MELLRIIRSKAGPHRTVGISDEETKRFLANDVNLGLAIKSAHEVWQVLDAATTYARTETDLINEVYDGWCNFYAEDTVNPFIPLFAKGPWIITTHGAVIHDSGGYGMLGFGHNPDDVLKILSKPQVMANIMTPSLAQRNLVAALRKEIGHSRLDKACPFDQFILMNSGSEGNAVVDRIVDVHTGHVRGDREKVVGVSLKHSFHGRTLKPAVISDSSGAKYISSKCDTLTRMKREYNRIVEPNDIGGLRRVFEEAKTKGEFVEAVYLEAVMGEGNPGQAILPEFYLEARKLTLQHDAMLVIDSVQAGIRCHGVLSLVDYPGFQSLPCPDFEVFSKALNGGQYPVSLIALSSRAVASYKRGVYGNTMTTAPRACDVATCIVSSFSGENAVIRTNIPAMGAYALDQFKKLQAKYPRAITNVTGTGLLYAVHLDPHVYPVVAVAGAEYWLRTQGVGVIHGGENALRFTPHFKVTMSEIDLQVNTLERFLKATGYLTPQLGLIETAREETTKERTGSDFLGASSLFFIKGHLFDKNVVNQILNTVECNECVANITRLRLGCCASEESELTLEIQATEETFISRVVAMIEETCTRNNCLFCPTDAQTEASRL